MSNEDIFNENTGIAYKIFSKYQNKGIDDDDLKQICLMGLWNSILTFNKDKGKFSTYAYNVIKNSVIDELRKTNKLNKNVSLEELTIETGILEENFSNIELQLYLNYLKSNLNTESDIKIFELYLKGYSSKIISDEVNLSVRTVNRKTKKIKEDILKFKN